MAKFPIPKIIIEDIELNIPCGLNNGGEIKYKTIYPNKTINNHINSESECDSDSDSDSDNDSDCEIYKLTNNSGLRDINLTDLYDDWGKIHLDDIKTVKNILKSKKKLKIHGGERCERFKKTPDKYKFNKWNFAKEIIERYNKGILDIDEILSILFECDISLIFGNHIIPTEFNDNDTDSKVYGGIIEDYKKVYKFSGKTYFSLIYPGNYDTIDVIKINDKHYEDGTKCHGYLYYYIPYEIIYRPETKEFWFQNQRYGLIDDVGKDYNYRTDEYAICKHTLRDLVGGHPSWGGFKYKEYNRIISEKIKELKDSGYTLLNPESDIVKF